MAETDDARLLEETREHLIGKGIVVDPRLRGFYVHDAEVHEETGVSGRSPRSPYRAREPRIGLMPELIQEYKHQVQSLSGVRYTVLAYGEVSSDGNWEGWLEFRPTSDADSILHTGRETRQPDRKALAYWASGLEAIYLEGAFARAIRVDGR
jgi:hypothetical protein